MTGYARLPDVRSLINAAGSSAQDGDIVRAINEASRFARSYTARWFHDVTGTWYYSGDGCRELVIGDFASITSLKISADRDQPTTFGYTLVEGVDYTLWPRNAASEERPYRSIVLNPQGQFATFPVGVDNVQIVGARGWPSMSDQVFVSGTAVTGTLTDASDLVVTTSVSVADVVEAGDTLILEGEQVEVIAVSATAITVARGINGTTAVAHAAVNMYIRRYPADIERAVAADAARYLWWGARGAVDQAGVMREPWPVIRDTLLGYANPAAVV